MKSSTGFHDSILIGAKWSGKSAKVEIGENVLIGSNVKILKGVKIGNNTVIANGAVVTRSVPENMMVFGNPGRGGMGLVQE